MTFTTRLEYEGKPLYNKESSANIHDHTKHWRNELIHFLDNGGTLIVILTKMNDFFVYTGTKDISGTGRSQKVINHVTPHSNYRFLPFSEIKFFAASGKTVTPSNPLVAEFHKNFKDFLFFDTYLNSDKIIDTTFTTKNKDRILGANLKIRNGYVYFIPNINLEESDLRSYDSTTHTSYWNEDGIRMGKILLNNLVEIDNAIRKEQNKTPKPDWISAEEYKLEAAEKTLELITKNNLEIEKRQIENVELKNVLEDQESLKELLYESGKPLERAVIKALGILGYKAENYNDGELELDQVITSPEGHRLIGECEGKDNKDIDVSKFRQLLDGLNADFEREEVEEKAYGILFGNPQRLMKPEERTLSFTQKCQSGALREKIGLVKTEDLFIVARYISESGDNDFAKICREAIIEQLGQIIVFPTIP